MADSWVYPRVFTLSLYIVLLRGQPDQCDNPSPLSPLCYSMPYNSSSFPNRVYNMIDATTAHMEIQTFQPLITAGCSDVIREFLCSVYFPDCEATSGDIPPCREVCVAARRGCETLMTNFGFQWPSHLNCVNFPSRGERVCTYFESKMNFASPTTTTKGEQRPVPTTTATTTTLIRGTEARTKTITKATPMVTTTIKLSENTTTTPTALPKQCSDISRLSPLCEGMPYNTSSFPNSVLGIQTSEEAGLLIRQFYPLIKVQCSDVIKEFLCSAYYPECDSMYGDIPPCKETCEYAEVGCGTLMMKFGFEWPQSLNCDKFPLRAPKRCAYYESKMLSTTSTTSTTTTTTSTSSPAVQLPAVCKTEPQNVALPNSLGHWNLQEAINNFESFHSMLTSGCSSELSQYLCHVHFPRSIKDVKPCWEFCLRVRTQCLFQLPVPWPKSFRCESFPAKVTSHCLDEQQSPSVVTILQGAFRLFASLLSLATST